MEHTSLSPTIYYTIVILAAIAGLWRSKSSRQLISDLKDRMKLLEDSDHSKGEEIRHLQGQIDVLKTLPLKGIDKSLKLLTEYISKHDEAVTKAKEEIIRAIQAK